MSWLLQGETLQWEFELYEMEVSQFDRGSEKQIYEYVVRVGPKREARLSMMLMVSLDGRPREVVGIHRAEENLPDSPDPCQYLGGRTCAYDFFHPSVMALVAGGEQELAEWKRLVDVLRKDPEENRYEVSVALAKVYERAVLKKPLT